jgi:CheY-like chemotaxis protein
MPGQDGLVTAQTIQESFWQKREDDAKLPIMIMVTAFDRDELMAQPGLAWVDQVLSKPVTTSSLYDAVAKIVHQRNSDQPLTMPTNARDNLIQIPGVRILVVDDSELNLELAQLLLEDNGASVQCVANGQEALNWLAMYPTEVDIILMDVQMPIMDGYTATQLIRQDARWQQLPVVALSAGVLKEERDTALAAGMDDFVAKPLDVDQLITTIQRLTGCQPQPSVSDKEDKIAHVAISNDIPNLPGIDVTFALKQWHDFDLYLRHLHKFISDYQRFSGTLTQLMAGEETDAASKLLHKLKGVASNLALIQVAEQALAMELAIKSGTMKADATDELQHAIDQACADIALLASALPPTTNQAIAQSSMPAIELLRALLDALDHDNPALAEPIITQLQGRMAEGTLAAISDQLQQFHFRVAEKLVLDAILAIESQNSNLNH